MATAFVGIALPGRIALAVTTNWNTTSNGAFGVASNWDNGVPGPNDTAVFREGTGAVYTVTFPGANSLIDPPVNTVSDRLIVGNNTVSFTLGFNRVGTYALDNPTTAEAGRGVIIGEFGGVVGDVAVLNTALPWSATAATIGDGISATGTLNVNSSTFTVTGSSGASGDTELIVGNAGSGAMTVSNGAQVLLTGSLGNAVIADDAQSTGAVHVSGAGSKWNAADGLTVGNNGTATLTIDAAGTILTNAAVIASAAGSSGNAKVSGADSSWSTVNSLTIANHGVGSLTIEKGGSVSQTSTSFGAARLGFNPGSHGTATVTGGGSTWSVAVGLSVGDFGQGDLNILAGGTVSCVAATIGDAAPGVGTGHGRRRGVGVEFDRQRDCWKSGPGYADHRRRRARAERRRVRGFWFGKSR